MSCLYIGAREQGVRDCTDQLPHDQHKLDRYAEKVDNYEMSQSNTHTFKTLILSANTNPIDAIKTYKL